MKYMVIAFPLTVLMDILIFINFFQWQQQAVYEFEQRQMDLQVNYSVDAAVHDMLHEGTHLDTDYATWGEMTVEPEVALNTYVSVLLRNLGWSDNEYNRQDLIDSSIPFFCVAAYDGYYMYCRQTDYVQDTDGSDLPYRHYPMMWTPKIPYSNSVWSSDNRYNIYIYNLGFNTYDLFQTARPANGTYPAAAARLAVDLPILRGTSNGPGSVTDAKAVVNNELTDACNNALYLGLMDVIDNSWYLPSSFSTWSNNNPVESPTVLTYITRSDGRSWYETSTFGIGGAKIKDAEFCICYTRDGRKLYTYSSNRDIVVDKYGVTIEVITPNAKDAAKRGYFYDLEFS